MARLPQLRSFEPQNALIGYRQGAQVVEEQQNRNALLKAGKSAAAGDFKGAAGAAFEGGNLQAGVAFQNMSQAEATKELQTVARLAFAADTPEKWAQLQQAVGAKYGPERAASLGGFETRDSIIAEAQTLDSMISQRFQEGEINRKQSNFERQFAASRADAAAGRALQEKRLDATLAGANDTALQKNYRAAVSQGFEGTIFDYQKALNEAKAGGKPLTEAQSKAAGFADRMISANRVLGRPEITQAATDAQQQGLSSVPLVSNFLTSDDRQLFEQAQRDFVNSILRRESGAVISDSEFDNAAKQYFPQPGDSPAVILQKAQNRELAIKGIIRAAGPAAEGLTVQQDDTGGVVDAADYFNQ